MPGRWASTTILDTSIYILRAARSGVVPDGLTRFRISQEGSAPRAMLGIAPVGAAFPPQVFHGTAVVLEMEHLRDPCQSLDVAAERIACNLECWVERLSGADLPILRATARQFARMAAEGDEELSPRDIAQVVLRDPMMTAKLYVHLQRVTGARKLADITTVDRNIVMLGVPPFLRAFAQAPLIEDVLRGNTPALFGLIRVIQRARRAAEIAGQFAAWRNDRNFEEIMISAMLHDLAEMSIWWYAPALALEVEGRLAANPQLRSVNAQETVFGIRLNGLQIELIRSWGLPGLLVRMMDDEHAESPGVRNVLLAVNIARHSMHGWDNAALPDDYKEAAELLSTTPERIRELVQPSHATDG